MILNLAQYVQSFLRDNYKGPQKSFYEEMLNNQRKQQEKQALEEQRRLEFLKMKEEREVKYQTEEKGGYLGRIFFLRQLNSFRIWVVRSFYVLHHIVEKKNYQIWVLKLKHAEW